MLATLTRPLLDLLFPPRCLACTVGLGEQEQWLCLDCEDSLPRFANEPWAANELCQKLWGRLPLGFGMALYQYQLGSEVQQVLHSLKYHDRREACRHFGRQMGELYREMMASGEFTPADQVAFVPMHSGKLRRRGYNQAELIAQGFAEATGLPLFTGLIKTHKTESQTRKGRAARVENQRGAFALSPKTNLKEIDGRHILLIDDVVTTGATIEQAAVPLIDAGAKWVSVAAIANV